MPKPEKETISFRIDADKKAELDAIAEAMDRDRSYILNEAIVTYLDVYRWQSRQIELGLAEAAAGHFVPDEEVQERFKKWTS